LEVHGKAVQVGKPEIVHDRDRAAAPPGVRHILGILGVADFLYLTKT
jgi:hypothetical protein